MKPTRSLTIVVASPGDVADERNSINKVAEELNKTIARERSLHIDVVRWETDTYPGFHVDGPQAIIDDLLDIEDCDIFIGIFWVRFGTPTKDARSGTEHEIRKAYEAWKRTNHPHIMLYFNEEPYSPKLEEFDQWRQVLSFKREISQEALYCAYKGIDQFTDLVRDHLTKFIIHMTGLPQQNAHTNTGTAPSAPPPHSVSIERQIALWLDVKGSEKKRTLDQYQRNIAHYREFLREYGFDLNSEDERVISTLVKRWAKTGTDKKVLSEATVYQRICIAQSFYQFACDHHWMSRNPIEKVKRQKNQRKEPLNLDSIVETLKHGLKSIDRSQLGGKRDYALLYLFFTTFRRSSDLVHLKCGDIQMKGNRVVLTFANSKDKEETLSPDASRALIDYLEMVYGSERPADAPLMINYSKQNRHKKKKEPIGIQALSNVCTGYFNINPEKIRGALKALSDRDGEGPRGVEKKLFGN